MPALDLYLHPESNTDMPKCKIMENKRIGWAGGKGPKRREGIGKALELSQDRTLRKNAPDKGIPT